MNDPASYTTGRAEAVIDQFERAGTACSCLTFAAFGLTPVKALSLGLVTPLREVEA